MGALNAMAGNINMSGNMYPGNFNAGNINAGNVNAGNINAILQMPLAQTLGINNGMMGMNQINQPPLGLGKAPGMPTNLPDLHRLLGHPNLGRS